DFHTLVGVVDRDAIPRPGHELDVVLAVAERDRPLRREPEALREKVEPGRLRDARRGELEEVRERLGDVHAAVEARLHPLLELVEDERVVDHDELRRRIAQPGEDVADLVQLDVLEVGVLARTGSDLGDVELVRHVAVHPEPFVVQRPNRVERELERDGHVSQPLPGLRFRDDGALVADDRVVEPRLEGVRPHGLEHAPRDENDVHSLGAHALDRFPCARAKHDVLSDQRAVEVARNCVGVARKVSREVQPFGFVRKSTSAVMSDAGSFEYVFGITFGGYPFWMYLFGSTIDSLTNAASGCFACFAYCGSLSRSGPIVPLAAARVYVWQALQPWATKMPLPGASCLTVPTTVTGNACEMPWLPQPASVS